MSIYPTPCPRCGQKVLIARVLGGERLVLDAVRVVGGDIATWTIGYNPSQLTLMCKKRPAQVAPPYDMPAERQKYWDGYAAANRREWYVEHIHNMTSQQIVEQRAETSSG